MVHIDKLIDAVESMPDDALKDTLGKYGELIDVINAAKAAQNALNEAMGKNPNEGYETRGSAIDQMKTLMEQGMIGSESELWDIAKAYGFTYESAKTITENADALHKFITARQGWYKTDKDGNYTYEGTENVINSIEKATKSDKFKTAMKEAFGEGVNIEDLFQWDYENGELSFDFDNENLDGIIQALAKTDELAGLTSEEFTDLLTQIGMFFNVNWQDTSDVSNSIKKIADESGTADEKIQKMSDTVEAYVEKVTGKDIDMDSLTQASIDAMDCKDSIKELLKEYLELKDAVLLAEQNVDNANKTDVNFYFDNMIIAPAYKVTYLDEDGTELKVSYEFLSGSSFTPDVTPTDSGNGIIGWAKKNDRKDIVGKIIWAFWIFLTSV